MTLRYVCRHYGKAWLRCQSQKRLPKKKNDAASVVYQQNNACISSKAELLVLVLLITGEGNQACYPIKYKIKLINIIHNILLFQ